jgi:hypothetical protein
VKGDLLTKIKKQVKEQVKKFYSLLMILLGIIMLAIYFFNATPSNAANRLNLDDINVKGELLNDDRLVILSRDKNELRNYVKFRTNYRSEMIEELPQPAPGVKY